LTFLTFDSEDERPRVPCSYCGRVWRLRRNDTDWFKTLVRRQRKDDRKEIRI
jgi:hypothetical protein